MANSDVICGLDMGSGRVTCVLARASEEGDKVEVLGGASVPCRGLKGGVVVNIQETARAVAAVIEEAEAAAEAEVKDVNLAVRGTHLESFNNRGVINIARTDKEITIDDVQSVIENAKAVPISNDREILHVLPQGYALDRTRGVPDPVGMEGSLLEVEVHIVTASSSHLSNLVKSVNKAGFNVSDTLYGMLAVGGLVVSAEERELGCLLLDFGGQSLSMGIYHEGALRYSKELALGSDLITRDLSYKLRTSLAAAQAIKERHGAALSRFVEADEEVSFVGADGTTPHKIKAHNLLDVVQPRVQEIFEKVAEELERSNFADLVMGGGAILTGGGALLKGAPEAASELLEMQVRLGIPSRASVSGAEHLLTLPYAGALAVAAHPLSGAPGAPKKAPGRNGWKKRFSALFEDIF